MPFPQKETIFLRLNVPLKFNFIQGLSKRIRKNLLFLLFGQIVVVLEQ
jgi:hypothetical protein